MCTVHFVPDEKNNLYWMSTRNTQHSQEITNDPKAAVTIVKDIEDKQALQIAGMAYGVPDEELERVHALYIGKYGPKEYSLEEIKKHKPDGRAYWVFRPIKMFFWDGINFPGSPKQEVLLSQ
jgi:uncharacterized protein YhbP (UPF0306 family)